MPQGHGRAPRRASSSAGGSSGAQPAMRSSGAPGRPVPHWPGARPARTATPLSYWLRRALGVALLVSGEANQLLTEKNQGGGRRRDTRRQECASARAALPPLSALRRLWPRPICRHQAIPLFLIFFFLVQMCDLRRVP